MPQEPWRIVYCDYKGPISPQKYYIHTMMDGYSRYPEVYITRSEKLTELKKCASRAIRTHGRPDEIWTDGGPPYNSNEWSIWTKHWGAKAKKTTPYHPPANGMVERFNQNLKLVILAAHAAGHDPEEEVDKYVAAYRRLPTLDEDVFGEGDLSEEEQEGPVQHGRPTTRSTTRRGDPPTEPRQQSQPRPPTGGADAAEHAQEPAVIQEPEGATPLPVEQPAPPRTITQSTRRSTRTRTRGTKNSAVIATQW